MTSASPTPDGEKGLAALRRGDVAAAAPLLKSAFAQNDDGPEVLLALAQVARAQSDFATCLDAADRYLKNDPRHIYANIIKGDALSALGRTRTAGNFYMAAARLAQSVERVPEELAREVRRAEKACHEAITKFEQNMRRRLAELGVERGAGRSRIEQTVDIILGQKQAFLQQPTKFYMPELAAIQFFDVADFPWARTVAAGKKEIKEELQSLLANQAQFDPYIAFNPKAPAIDVMSLYNSAKWSSFHLVRDGDEIPDNIAQCPRTYEILKAAPIPWIRGRSPNILFSKLAPGAHIAPHHGEMNIRLLCHLPLIVPPGCQLRVGNQIRDVAEGEPMIFDDTIEHEARNTSSLDRVVLIFDVWRPELSEAERKTICSIFAAIEEFE